MIGFLSLDDGRIGIEFRIVLGQREQPSKHPFECAAGRQMLLNGSGVFGAVRFHHLGAELRHPLQQAAFMIEITLRQLQDIRQKVEPLAQLHIDRSQCFSHTVSARDKSDIPEIAADGYESDNDPKYQLKEHISPYIVINPCITIIGCSNG